MTTSEDTVNGAINLDRTAESITYNMENCDRARCVTCKGGRLCMDNSVTNHITGEVYPLKFTGSCLTKNCVYVIKCKQSGCQFQYIGHTINHIASRVSQHKSSIRKGGGCKALRDHFTMLHDLEDISIMPIDLLPKNISLKERESIEDSWILKVNTVFPYGLNVRVKKVGIMDSEIDVITTKSNIYSKFDVVKISRGQRGGVSNITSTNFDISLFFDSVLSGNVEFNTIRSQLCALKKKLLKLVYIKSISLLNDGIDNILPRHFCLMVKDLSWFYLLRMGVSKSANKQSSNYVVVKYVNKFVEYVNFRKIFKNPEVLQAAPFKSTNLSVPIISFKYTPTIRSTILNYKQTYLENTDLSNISCNCTSSNFIDPHHQHIVTGDLSIIENTKLRQLLSKGLNYRDQAPPNKILAIKAIKDAVNIYADKMSERYSIPMTMFSEWKINILEHVKQQLEGRKNYKFNSILSDKDVVTELNNLHQSFVFVPTDKAANNVTIMCKKFYVSLIQNELKSSTFERVDKSVHTIFTEHLEFMDKYGIKMEDSNNKLPFLYITPKQHKNPTGFRFITAGNACTLQQLSVYLGICLKSMLHSAHNKSKYDHKFHNRNDFFVIESNQPILDFICRDKYTKGKKSISTFDFSTLYTSIPHSQLKDNLYKFVNRIFEFKDKDYIIPNLYTKKAYFSNAKGRNVGFNKDDLLNCLYYLIDNSYVIYNDIVFRQTVGIPMGTNAGPQVANVYLHVYEFEYIKSLIELGDEDSLMKLRNIFRYQDDLISFNDEELLNSSLNKIYPKEMVVNNTNISPRKCSYLDLTISIFRNQYLVKLYDKRKDYKFNVISYPFLDGNIPTNQSYGVFISQLVRFSKINSTFKGFVDDTRELVKKLTKQGFLLAALRNKFFKFYQSYLNIWGKFGFDIFDEMSSIFS